MHTERFLYFRVEYTVVERSVILLGARTRTALTRNSPEPEAPNLMESKPIARGELIRQSMG